MILDEGELPPSYLAEVRRLLSMIETAVDTAAVQDVGRYAEGVVRGIEIARSLRAGDIEQLYVLVESAISAKLEITERP